MEGWIGLVVAESAGFFVWKRDVGARLVSSGQWNQSAIARVLRRHALRPTISPLHQSISARSQRLHDRAFSSARDSKSYKTPAAAQQFHVRSYMVRAHPAPAPNRSAAVRYLWSKFSGENVMPFHPTACWPWHDESKNTHKCFIAVCPLWSMTLFHLCRSRPQETAGNREYTAKTAKEPTDRSRNVNLRPPSVRQPAAFRRQRYLYNRRSKVVRHSLRTAVRRIASSQNVMPYHAAGRTASRALALSRCHRLQPVQTLRDERLPDGLMWWRNCDEAKLRWWSCDWCQHTINPINTTTVIYCKIVHGNGNGYGYGNGTSEKKSKKNLWQQNRSTILKTWPPVFDFPRLLTDNKLTSSAEACLT